MYTGIAVGLVVTVIMVVCILSVYQAHQFIQRITKEDDHEKV